MMLIKQTLLTAALATMLSGAAYARSEGCYWVDGRLTLGNGTPAIRIWPRGTYRLLGVTTADYHAETYNALPAQVRTFLRENRSDRIWGQFKICPLALDRPGWMRPVTVVAARSLRLHS